MLVRKTLKVKENKVVTNGSTVTVTDKDDDLPRKITFSKVSLGGTEIAGAEIKIYKGDKAEGTAVESWTSEAGKSKDLNLAQVLTPSMRKQLQQATSK